MRASDGLVPAEPAIDAFQVSGCVHLGRGHHRRHPGVAFGPQASPRATGSGFFYLIPITIESGPTSGSKRVAENPASAIQAVQSAPV